MHYVLSRIVGGVPFFVSLTDCPAGIKVPPGSISVPSEVRDMLSSVNPWTAIRLAYNYGILNIGYGEIMFKGSPESKLQRLGNNVIIDGDSELKLNPVCLYGDMKFLGCLLDGSCVYSSTGAKIAFLDNFYVMATPKNFIDHANQLLNESMSSALQSSIFTLDAPAVAKKSLKAIEEDVLFAPFNVVARSKFNMSYYKDKAKLGLCKDIKQFASIVAHSYSDIGNLGLVYAGKFGSDPIGYDINYTYEHNNQKYFKPTDYGIIYPAPKFKATCAITDVDGKALEEASVESVKRLAIYNARKEIIKLRKASVELQANLELASSNYTNAKNNANFGYAKVRTIMDQVRAVLEAPVVYPYNNQTVGVVGDFLQLDADGSIKEVEFYIRDNCYSGGVSQKSCGNTYWGLRYVGAWESANIDSTECYWNGEELGMAPNFLTNMGIAVANKIFTISKRQTYKPWLGKEREVVPLTTVSRPCYSGRSLITLIKSYLEQLVSSVKATIKLNHASELIVQESLSSYSKALVARDKLLSRIEMLETVIATNGSDILFRDMHHVSISDHEDALEIGFIAVEDCLKACSSLIPSIDEHMHPYQGTYKEGLYIKKGDKWQKLALSDFNALNQSQQDKEGVQELNSEDTSSGNPLCFEFKSLPLNTRLECEGEFGKATFKIVGYDDGEYTLLLVDFEQREAVELPDYFRNQAIFSLSKNQANVLRFYYGVDYDASYEPVNFMNVVSSSKSLAVSYSSATAAAALGILRGALS